MCHLYKKQLILLIFCIVLTGCISPLHPIETDVVDISWAEGKIVFFSDRRVSDTRPFTSQINTRYLFVMTEDGSEQGYYKDYGQRLIGSRVAWSPNGSQFAIAGFSGDQPSCLLIIDSEGQECLVENGRSPAWSPNGDWIAFDSPIPMPPPSTQFNSGLEIININTLERRRLAEFYNTTKFLVPTWSPDSSKVVFSVTIGNTPSQIFYIDLNDKELTQHFLTEGDMPAWAPNGTEIAFEREGDIWLTSINADASRFIGNASSPSWSPDGASLIFSSSRSGNWEIYKVNIDGTNLTNLTNNSDNDYLPSWRP